MAEVNCRYCKKKFDRDKEPFIQIPTGKAFRYAHANCYLEKFNSGEVKEHYRVWDPKNAATCFWCHRALDTTDPNSIAMPQLKGRWVHKGCNQLHPENDQEKLLIYILQLFQSKDNFIPPKLQKQVTQYEDDYEFTYSGMLKALKYWYEIKKHPIDRTRGIGIIPLIYDEAKRYYYALYLAQLQNEQIQDYSDYIPQDIEIKITPPKKKVEKRKLFSFLDEDEINEQ